MHLENLTPEELLSLEWLLDGYVRDTVILTKQQDEEHDAFLIMCGECGQMAINREAIQHAPGCEAAPLWALYDKVEKLEADREFAELEAMERDEAPSPLPQPPSSPASVPVSTHDSQPESQHESPE